MFKVGDRVRVVSEGPDFTGRGHASLGMTGEVTQPFEDGGAYVRLDGSVNGSSTWAYDAAELAPENAASPIESPTLLDQFAMAALTGLCGSGDVDITTLIDEQPTDQLARVAYSVAQAMMKAREVQK